MPVSMHHTSQHGFSLTEVLVALLLLGLGLFGSLRLQAAAVRHQHDSWMQAHAHQLAVELAERMRMHPEVAALPSPADNPFLQNLVLAAGAAAPAPHPCVMQACTPDHAAALAEVRDWQQLVQQALPQARIRVCQDAAPGPADANTGWHCTPPPSDAAPLLAIKLGWGDTSAGPRNMVLVSPGHSRS